MKKKYIISEIILQEHTDADNRTHNNQEKICKKINPKTNWPQLRKAQKQNLILSLNRTRPTCGSTETNTGVGNLQYVDVVNCSFSQVWRHLMQKLRP